MAVAHTVVSVQAEFRLRARAGSRPGARPIRRRSRPEARSIGQGVKDWAIQGIVPSTLRDHVAQRALETFQFINVPMDAMCCSVMLFTCAQALRCPASPTNFAERETQFTSPAHEQQALLIFFGVEPVPARAAGRLRQNTNAFVVANGLDIYLGSLRQRADGHYRFVSMVPTCDA